MTLAAGTHLGPYEILSPIGAGGMGEVYKARDTRLDRNVAIKVLSQQLSSRPEAKGRFEREAKTIAALNHPHICTLFDVGQHQGTDYLVMEYIEGQTLAERLEKGALPIADALKIAVEIADALDKAHRQKVTHRDLKPGNIMLTKAGAKLLDFGLAKLKEDAQPQGALSSLPTNAAVTAQGTILGTLQYMAPEQLEGREADARTDIFAFGVLLYEMVTGKKAFDGKSQASLISAILSAEPEPLSKLQPMTPQLLDRIVKTCLAKDPDNRWQTASDLKREVEWISEAGSETNVASFEPIRSRRIISAIAALSFVATVVIGAALWLRPAQNLVSPQPARIPVATAPGVTLFHDSNEPNIAISPDGRRLVYAGSSQGQRLYLQDLDRLGTAVAIAGTEGAQSPFFSSDGNWLAFVANNKLRKLALSGGAPVALADVSLFRGGVWSPDDETIYFVPGVQTGIWKVPAQGGKPIQITTPDRDGYVDFAHWWPISMLPGGQRLLYTSCCGRTRVMVLDLVTGKRTSVIENGFFARYVSGGYLVFGQGPSLLAARFDPESLEIGNPVKILDNIITSHEVHGQYSISQTGTLVYFDGISDFQRNLVRIDRNGTIQKIANGARPYLLGMRLANDGRRLALSLTEGEANVFVYDLLRDDFDRVIVDSINDFDPVWTPDGRNLVFSSNRSGQLDLYMSPADKSRPAELLYASDYPKWAKSWSPDGKLLAFGEDRSGTGLDIGIYSRDDKKVRPFRNASFNERFPAFSPDGRWLAYSSDELGRFEVYVVPYPGPGPTCKVSTSGGDEPRWSADGKELFYRRGSTAMAADVSDRNFCNANPRALFEGLESRSWDVSPKGDFFITLEPREPPRLQLVLNWFEELNRLVPAGN